MRGCPTCGRKSRYITDFPIVSVLSFKRVRLPTGVKLPHSDKRIYVDKKTFKESDESGQGQGRCLLYPEVERKFTKKMDEYTDSGGWKWKRPINGHEVFMRSHDDQRRRIMRTINPYLGELERLVGKTFSIGGLKPYFSLPDNRTDSIADSCGFFNIPDTGYKLAILTSIRDVDKGLLSGEVYQSAIHIWHDEAGTSGELIVGRLGFKGLHSL